MPTQTSHRVSYDFSQQVAFVTGASSGIGQATALAFAKNNARVVVSDVNEAGLQTTVERLKSLKADFLALGCDVSDANQVRSAVAETVARYGRLDFAFNNAGIEGRQASFAEISEEEWDRVIAVNLKGVWLCMKYQIEVMLKQKSGSIVNNSSIAGVVAYPEVAAYAASKHGILGLTRTAAVEYATSGLRVNAVCPGVIQTAMVERFAKGDQDLVKKLASAEPIGRLGEVSEVAEAVLWLSSSAASFVTGHPLLVDGGWVAR